MPALEAPALEEIRAARERVRGLALRTPLLRLNVDDAPAEVWLKLENLQPIGSFKLRGAGNALRSLDPAALRDGVWTTSAGNMAQGLAWVAREAGVACSVLVPDHAPTAKLGPVERMGARIVKVPFDEWWQALATRRHPAMTGRMIHPVGDRSVMAGNGTIALEILEDLGDVDTILVPYGGGALSTGIAAGVRGLRAATRVFGCEVATAAPLSAALAAGAPCAVDYTATFVDGIGGKGVLAEMWPLASTLLDGSIVVSLEEAAAALRLLAERNHVIAEGAGAVPVAAAMSGRAGAGRIVCVVSGGNIDAATLAAILIGAAP